MTVCFLFLICFLHFACSLQSRSTNIDIHSLHLGDGDPIISGLHSPIRWQGEAQSRLGTSKKFSCGEGPIQWDVFLGVLLLGHSSGSQRCLRLACAATQRIWLSSFWTTKRRGQHCVSLGNGVAAALSRWPPNAIFYKRTFEGKDLSKPWWHGDLSGLSMFSKSFNIYNAQSSQYWSYWNTACPC